MDDIDISGVWIEAQHQHLIENFAIFDVRIRFKIELSTSID